MNYFIEFEDEDQLQLETPYAARLVAARHPVLKLTQSEDSTARMLKQLEGWV